MGYYMDVVGAVWALRPGEEENALAALKRLTKKQQLTWCNTERVERAKTFVEAFVACRWLYLPEEQTVEFYGEKLGDEDTIFNTLAPFVALGSWIEASGESGYRWRWRFNGQIVHEESGLRPIGTIGQNEVEYKIQTYAKRIGGVVRISREIEAGGAPVYTATTSTRQDVCYGSTPLKAVRALWKEVKHEAECG